LYGSKGERFEQIKAEMTKRLGYEPSNPELVGMLMAHYTEHSGLGQAIDDHPVPSRRQR
jgi:hypothetical protein